MGWACDQLCHRPTVLRVQACPCWGPSTPFHCSQRARASAAPEFQASTIPLLPCLTPHPPEPHLRWCHGNKEHQALAAKGAPERGPGLRLGRWGCNRRRQANLLFPGLLPAPHQPWAGPQIEWVLRAKWAGAGRPQAVGTDPPAHGLPPPGQSLQTKLG